MKAFRYTALLALVVLALIVAACGPSGRLEHGRAGNDCPDHGGRPADHGGERLATEATNRRRRHDRTRGNRGDDGDHAVGDRGDDGHDRRRRPKR